MTVLLSPLECNRWPAFPTRPRASLTQRLLPLCVLRAQALLATRPALHVIWVNAFLR